MSHHVIVLGGGVAGVNAAQMAVGMRADVTIYDISNERLAELDMFFGSQIKTAYASRAAIARLRSSSSRSRSSAMTLSRASASLCSWLA